MSKSDFSQNLLASSSSSSSNKPQTAADKIPVIARFAVSERAKETLNLVSGESILRHVPCLSWSNLGREIC